MERKFANKIKDNMFWWLGKKNPFIINDEYKLELLFIDKINNSAKIRITNIKTDDSDVRSVEVQDEQS